MSDFQQRPNSGTLWTNKFKKHEKASDFKGSIHIDKDMLIELVKNRTSELIEINKLVSMAEEIGGVKLEREYDLDAPTGVAGRNSDNTMIKDSLGWEPSTPFAEGLDTTYHWIESQYNDRKAGKRTVS